MKEYGFEGNKMRKELKIKGLVEVSYKEEMKRVV